MSEVWRDIPGTNGLYRVSNLGRVWSQPRERTKGGILTPALNKANGYQHLRIFVNKKPITRTIHQLVLESFVGLKPDGMECRHLDGNKRNNRLENLAWGTRQDNHNDQKEHGTRIRGERVGSSKLTRSDVIRIKTMRGKHSDIAKQFGVCRSLISQILRGEIWAHVTNEDKP